MPFTKKAFGVQPALVGRPDYFLMKLGPLGARARQRLENISSLFPTAAFVPSLLPAGALTTLRSVGRLIAVTQRAKKLSPRARGNNWGLCPYLITSSACRQHYSRRGREAPSLAVDRAKLALLECSVTKASSISETRNSRWMFAGSSSLAAAARGNRIMTLPQYCTNAFRDLPSKSGCRSRRYGLPTVVFWGARQYLSQKQAAQRCPPSVSTRHALPDAHGYTLHRTSTHARPREDSHPNNTFVPRTRRGVGAAHAVPPPAHTARAVPDRKRTNERTTEGSPCLRWHFARSLGARAGS